MNQALALEIVGCLRVSAAPEISLAPLGTFGRSDWKRTLAWLEQSGLALYFWQRVKELGVESMIPPETQARLARNLEDNRLRITQMAEEFDSLNRRFREAGIEYAVLKGFALIPEYCPDALLRTQYDYDYLVRPASLSQAEQALRAAGWVRRYLKEDHPVVYVQSARPPRLLDRAQGLYSAQLQRLVELHIRLGYAEEEKICLGAPEDALDRAGWRTWQGIRFRTLSDEDGLTFQVLHAFRHMLSVWCRLSWFLEIAQFLERRSTDTTFWGRFGERSRGLPRIADAAGVVFSLAMRLFHPRASDAVSRWTIETLPPALKLWVERYGKPSALRNFSSNKLGLFLQREFIQDPAAWRKIQRRRLLPFHWPHRVAQSPGPRLRSRFKARWRRWVYVFRRLAFHLGEALRYTLEHRRWKRALHENCEDQACRDRPQGSPRSFAISTRRDKH